jgi:hypothetical protein
MIHLGDEILGVGKRFRVLNVVAFEGEDSRIRPGCYRSRRRSGATANGLQTNGPQPAVTDHHRRPVWDTEILQIDTSCHPT